jgi:hypothetical protein
VLPNCCDSWNWLRTIYRSNKLEACPKIKIKIQIVADAESVIVVVLKIVALVAL